MIRKIQLLVLWAIFMGMPISYAADVKPVDYARYVNPFIGTADNGHTFPGAALPFGMIQDGPETGRTEWKYCSGYNYADSTMVGFAHDHLNGCLLYTSDAADEEDSVDLGGRRIIKKKKKKKT